MALVPITFKADLGDDNPKGNITPEYLADMVAFLYPKTAGVLNITGQDCSFIGQPSVVGSVANISLHKGIIVIYGRAIYIEEDTRVGINLPNSGSVNGVFGIRVNLAENGTNEVTWYQRQGDFASDNLLQKPETGVYEFPLYNYSATSNTFTIGNKTDKIIQNIKDEDFITRDIGDNSKKIATTEFVKNSGVELLNLSLKANVYAENSIISPANVTFSGYGVKVFNKNNNKFYWVGNLKGTFTTQSALSDTRRFSLGDYQSATQSYSINNIISGGSLSVRQSNNDPNDETAKAPTNTSIYMSKHDITDWVWQDNISYLATCSAYNFYQNKKIIMTITNIMIELN